MAKVTCNYQFPIHPAEMFKNNNLSKDARILRTHMIQNIALLSQTHTQDTLDNKLYIDVEDGEIVGFDISELTMPGANMCIGQQRIPLKNMKAKNWKTMKM
jgi:hypothetical protein